MDANGPTLGGDGEVRVAQWPSGCDDLGDVVEVGLDEAREALWGEAHG